MDDLPVIGFVQASSDDDIARARGLFREYETWIQTDLCFQSFEQELAELPGKYAPPEGRLLLAFQDGQLAGCVALRKIGEGVCEMKRLFVRPDCHGKGLGHRLIDQVVKEAREIGYQRMRLDTLERLTSARALYASFGFVDIPAYGGHAQPNFIYLEKVFD